MARTGPGVYRVTFDRSMVSCALVGTSTVSSTTLTIRHTEVDPTVAFVDVRNDAGVGLDSDFDLIATCPS